MGRKIGIIQEKAYEDALVGKFSYLADVFHRRIAVVVCVMLVSGNYIHSSVVSVEGSKTQCVPRGQSGLVFFLETMLAMRSNSFHALTVSGSHDQGSRAHID